MTSRSRISRKIAEILKDRPSPAVEVCSECGATDFHKAGCRLLTTPSGYHISRLPVVSPPAPEQKPTCEWCAKGIPLNGEYLHDLTPHLAADQTHHFKKCAAPSVQSEPRGMDQAETFEWLRQRSIRLDETLAENERLVEKNIQLTLELARLTVKPVVDAERASENVGEIMNLRLDTPVQSDEVPEPPERIWIEPYRPGYPVPREFYAHQVAFGIEYVRVHGPQVAATPQEGEGADG